jgi:hypothetical protein
MNESQKILIQKGYQVMSQSKLAICSIVRDCSKSLKRNIPVVEKLRTYFKSSMVIIFENDSIDGTKTTIEKWRKESFNVLIESQDINSKTILSDNHSNVNKYFSISRISKMADYRNRYLKKLSTLDDQPDFVLIIDLDIAKIELNGIIHSFALSDQWDVICANSVSRSPNFRKRYHDSYALVELGHENIPQTEKSIFDNQQKWKNLKEGMPLVPVYSAFGGLSIFHYYALKGKEYSIIENNDAKVEVRCEHFSLCHEIRKSGFNRIFINPNMYVKYQNIDFKLMKKFLCEKFK